jgi:RNA polymerase sigma-32 factor
MRKIKSDAAGLTPEVAAQIAENLAVTQRDVIEMDGRLSGDLSLNAPVNADEGTVDWQDMLEDTSPNAETILAENDETTHQTGAIHAAMDVLTARERHVFEARRLSEHPPTLEELAHELSLSGERVRQIELRAFAKVKQAARHLVRGSNSGEPVRLHGRRRQASLLPIS